MREAPETAITEWKAKLETAASSLRPLTAS